MGAREAAEAAGRTRWERVLIVCGCVALEVIMMCVHRISKENECLEVFETVQEAERRWKSKRYPWELIGCIQISHNACQPLSFSLTWRTYASRKTTDISQARRFISRS